ncbi:MAG: hypothetical protein WA628_17140 [Terriglobales bacterium]
MRVSVLLGVPAAVLAVLLVIYVAVLRPWHLRWGSTAVETTEILPGDDLLQGSIGQVTRAITIDAPPEKIWPWLMQMGQDRGGFYSYTPLENMVGADMPQVHTLRAHWYARVPGETVWFATPKRFDGQGKMVAAVVDAPRAFVMVMPGDWQEISKGGRGSQGSWGFVQEVRVVGPVRSRHCKML